MQTPKRNLYGYAPKHTKNSTRPEARKLSLLDKKHIKQWYAMGFSKAAIARAYDISYSYTVHIVRGQKRK